MTNKQLWYLLTVGKHSMPSNTSIRPQKAAGEIRDENAEKNQWAVKHTEENTFAVIGNKSDLALYVFPT